MQPWSFVLVSNPVIKKRIREKAEEIEKQLYSEKIPEEWKNRLKPLKTDARKAFLEEAPYLICIFLQRFGLDNEGNEIKHYYTMESVGIATGFLICALHQLGISVLTYTPSPMNFLSDILNRPANEKPFIILAVGYPDRNYEAPALIKKTESDYLTIIK
ncbi:MAG: nitroreductase family protein [Chloroflexi bacterium]|nr:nitroreductase family protein [Chloroflexota bacterium]